MKKNIEILGIEETKDGIPMTTKAGKPYFRVKTSGLNGDTILWMSCFDMEQLATIKGFFNKTASLEIKTAGNYSNIEKCYGQAEEEDKVETIRPGESPKEIEGSKTSIRLARYRAVKCAISFGEPERELDLAIAKKIFEYIWDGK